MEKHVLIAVDNSPAARLALRYVGGLAADVTDLRATLLHIQPAISLYLTEEAQRDPAARREVDKLKDENARHSKALLEEDRQRLMEGGLPAAGIETASLPRHHDLAKDILDYAQKGRFDAIVVGRRGLTKLQSAILGSTSSNLLHHSAVLPVWVIDGEVPSERILVAVDGSEGSLRAVDHLSFIFAGSRRVRLDLFHVIPRLSETCAIDLQGSRSKLDKIGERGARHCIDHFHERAMERFARAGIHASQVQITLTPRMRSPGPGIIDQARKGGYGTVVIGRRGLSPSLFTGSVSRYVINRASDMALWVVP